MAVKMLFGISHIRMPGTLRPCPAPSFDFMLMPLVMAQVTGSLPPMWGIQIEFWASGFGLAPSLHLEGI